MLHGIDLTMIPGLAQHLATVTPQDPGDPRQETPEEAARRAQVVRQARRDRWAARVPLRYRDATLDGLSAHQDPGGRVSRWWESPSQTLVLFSTRPGVGKTHAAIAVGAHAVAHGAWAEAWTVTGLLADLRPDGPPDTLDRAVCCDLLVLDDLGRESDTAWVRERLHHVIDTRLREGRRLVVTTNLVGEAVAARYDDPFVDRLVDGATPVEVTGESRRAPAPW